MIASTASLIDAPGDDALRSELAFPDRDVWLPGGLTFSHGVSRLQANHRLDFATWTPVRHWQPPPVGSSTDVGDVVTAVRDNLARVAAQAPMTFCLTAGHDSRMLLACARPFVEQSTFITFGPEHETLDTEVAKVIARSLSLEHEVLRIEHASPAQRSTWVELTGSAVSGSILDLHPTLMQLDPARVLLPGITGEVGRTYYWDGADAEDTELQAADLATRMTLPPHPRLLGALDSWLEALPSLSTFQILDLAYIEHRLSCWAAPQHYGNQRSRFELAPLSSRASFDAMLRLPYEFRAEGGLFREVCRTTWPELLSWPVNRYPGMKGVARGAMGRVKRVARRITR